MKTILTLALLMILSQSNLFAQSNNYIEVDGKRTYLDSMTPQEIVQDKKLANKVEKQTVVVQQPKETTVIVIPQGPQINPLIDPIKPHYNSYSDRIRVKITNRRPTTKEYYESTGPGTLKKTEVYRGKKIEEEWKMEKGNLVKERKEIK